MSKTFGVRTLLLLIALIGLILSAFAKEKSLLLFGYSVENICLGMSIIALLTVTTLRLRSQK